MKWIALGILSQLSYFMIMLRLLRSFKTNRCFSAEKSKVQDNPIVGWIDPTQDIGKIINGVRVSYDGGNTIQHPPQWTCLVESGDYYYFVHYSVHWPGNVFFVFPSLATTMWLWHGQSLRSISTPSGPDIVIVASLRQLLVVIGDRQVKGAWLWRAYPCPRRFTENRIDGSRLYFPIAMAGC